MTELDRSNGPKTDSLLVSIYEPTKQVNLIWSLGFDRHLPGFDRYFVHGDEHSGEYNLRVVNATKEDEAKYECQVGPGRGNPPIRASAFLTVNRKLALDICLFFKSCYLLLNDAYKL